MNHAEKRELENALMSMGLTGLQDPDLCLVFAQIVEQFPGDKHWFFQGMLWECDPDKRYEMYHAIAPKFQRFKPLPFTDYEMRIMEEAGAMVSRHQIGTEGERPKAIQVGGTDYAVVPRQLASHAVATLTCWKCNISKSFVAETPVSAMITGREAGWIRDPGVNKELCPKCQPEPN